MENSTILLEETFTAPNTEPIRNDKSKGSKSIYWFKVIKPTSANENIIKKFLFESIHLPKSTNKDENKAAVTDCVNSSTVRKVDGTKVAPIAVQNWNFKINLK